MTSRRLSRREYEVLARYLRCRSQQQVAEELGIAERTVESHLGSAYRKLGTDSALGAALRLGWLRIPVPRN